MNLQSYMILAVLTYPPPLLAPCYSRQREVPHTRATAIASGFPILATSAPGSGNRAHPRSVGNIEQFRRDERCEQFSHSRVM